MRPLRRGSRGPSVARLQTLLAEQGFLHLPDETELGTFGPRTHTAVVHFQQTHLGRDGSPLTVDSWVGDETWWALVHASDESQRSRMDARIPRGLTPQRIALLETALAFHAREVREQPNGSNRGPVVDEVFPPYVVRLAPPGPPWCAYSAHHLCHKAHGRWPLGAHLGSCYRSFVRARARGFLRDAPIPGDLFVMLYRDDSGELTKRGHMGIVLRADDTHINTAEGNMGNRFAVSRRAISSCAGFINFYDESEQPTTWERGTFRGARSSGVGTR